MLNKIALAVCSTVLCWISVVQAQNPKYEMRGAWVATVFNLDWPLSTFDPPSVQQADMAVLFDELASSGINAIFFQVRSESDAMYDSAIEPWSRYLTGLQGLAPDPLYDPLEVAIEMAHERGMELHAWINPFRAVSQMGAHSIAANHVSITHPEWMLQINDIKIIDPGLPDARQYIVDIIADIVNRYRVDGIHFDDFFYPYPPNTVSLEDDSSFSQFGGDFLNINDWRRDNISVFVAEVQGAIKDLNPTVKFGISPFGIWRDGVPEGISGLSAVDVIFADPTAWFEEESVDYLIPQLYWPFGGSQDFERLADWWVEQADGIHIYPGIAAFKADIATSDSSRYSAEEIPQQIAFSRVTDGIEGNVFFRSRNLGPASNLGLTNRLKTDFYSTKAFTAPMLYFDVGPPDASTAISALQSPAGVELSWDPPLTGFAFANKHGVYRQRSDATIPNSRDMTNDPANLIAISWDPDYVDTASLEVGGRYFYAVTGVTPNSIEGPETDLVEVVLISTDTESVPGSEVLLSLEAYPNPVRSRLRMELNLGRAASISARVFDILGREVVDLLGGSSLRSAGIILHDWDLRSRTGSALAPGTYYLVVRTDREQISRPILVID